MDNPHCLLVWTSCSLSSSISGSLTNWGAMSSALVVHSPIVWFVTGSVDGPASTALANVGQNQFDDGPPGLSYVSGSSDGEEDELDDDSSFDFD